MKKEFKEKYDVLASKMSKMSKTSANGERKLLHKAYWFSYEAHKNQSRRSGEPYFSHCVEAANILAEYRMDETTVAACLLHDVVEDTGFTSKDLESKFGNTIARLVDGVTKISDLIFKKSENQEAESFRKLILSMAKDIRVIMIKFADRLHNMRTLEHLSRRRQIRMAQETLDVYAPLAFRFGIASLGWQFEDLALKFLDPGSYTYIDTKIAEKWDDRMKHIDEMKTPIIKELEHLKIKCRIVGRPKSYYSIYKKMRDQNVSFEEIFDLLAMRVIVGRKESCYAAVGVVHTLFTPVAERFKDFVATPKSNGYQSIHTTVVSPTGRMIEVQIRTENMDRTAELGIAAHWLYKAKYSDKKLDRQLGWVKQFIDWESDDPDPNEFMKSFKFDLFQSEIFVFTPRGKLVNLPEGSTPVDFAFAVHSAVGLKCIGAKINSKVMPLNTTLTNGDEVEILVSKKQNPQEYWDSFVKTSRARNQIKKWLNENRKKQYENLGRDILDRELNKYDKKFEELDEEHIKNKSGYSNLSMVINAIGKQEVSAQEIIRRMYPNEVERNRKSFLSRLPNILKRPEKDEAVINVHGEYPLVLELSKCCKPVPGDKIIGFKDEDKGVVVHRVKCKSIPDVASNKDISVNVEWAETNSNVFPVQIQVTGSDRKHFLKDMAVEISKMDINISTIHIDVKDLVAICDVTMQVESTKQLDAIMKNIENIKGIQKARRL